ncbi:hypothetical protein D9757_011746 [Collybiopsis confluens]|uniref:Uncharacterized protein n=1 Tax=Collybiopsis confluens TaxID=2823264 RepID=A0A8H5G842_9AGAR|nr:hypothetical protein D9757_011746 [Collybiopsis confluens]
MTRFAYLVVTSIALGASQTTFLPLVKTDIPLSVRLAVPHFLLLPRRHVHRYITSSIRRVYLDTSAAQNLHDQLAASQTQVQRLKQESERLMSFCEKYQNAAGVHAEGEAQAKREVDRLKRLLQETQDASKARAESTEWKGKWQQKSAEQTAEKSSRKRRKHTSHAPIASPPLFSDVDIPHDSGSVSPITPRRRVIRDLPTLRRSITSKTSYDNRFDFGDQPHVIDDEDSE